MNKIKSLKKIAVISTRLGGIDGVSIEANKWAEVFLNLRLTPIFVAGSFIKKTDFKQHIIKELDFNHPLIEKVRQASFNIIYNTASSQNEYKNTNDITSTTIINNNSSSISNSNINTDLTTKTTETTITSSTSTVNIDTFTNNFTNNNINTLTTTTYNKIITNEPLKTFTEANLQNLIFKTANFIETKITQIIKKEKIDYFSIENALSIPLNIPLGIALLECIKKNNIPTITRHHDFYWERKEFLNPKYSFINYILEKYFPPVDSNIKHIVINSLAYNSVLAKKNIAAFQIPNAFNFNILKNQNFNSKERAKEIKEFLELKPGELLFLQPTRIIKRKCIERTINLAKILKNNYEFNIKILISGLYEKNEMDYFYQLLEYSRKEGIDLIICNSFNRKNKKYPNVKIKKFFKFYNIYDLFNVCDLVTLPSDIEGFGNPVIEACAFKKPLFVNKYPVLNDFLQKGFDFVVIEKDIKKEAIDKLIKIFKDKTYRNAIVNNNFKIAKKNYSLVMLKQQIKNVFSSFKN